MDPYQFPELGLPTFEPTAADDAFGQILIAAIRTGKCDESALDQRYAESSFPQGFVRLVLVLYATGHKRILVSRSSVGQQVRFSQVLAPLLAHSRCAELATGPFRIQMDFVEDEPQPVDFSALSTRHKDERHFEMGIDGLTMKAADGTLNIFLPGDAYVRSLMTMGQVRDHLRRAYGDDHLQQAEFKRFRSASFLAGPSGWRRLYRGHPLVGTLNRGKVEYALELAISHIKRTQEADGKFLYYYEVALDSKRDHEHPRRDPTKNPYYNILRHSGGGLTCVFYEKLTQNGSVLGNARLAIDYLITQARVQVIEGREAAYIYSERKSKLGGAGLALYFIVEYQLTSGDERYRLWADRLSWHLINQITASGEFIYYNIYLDQPISEAENHQHFSFYYPGEAICGLAKYLHLIDPGERSVYFKKLRLALNFLLVVRPTTRASEYTAVPSDGWLMMGIKELWDFEEMREPMYADFVFSDADKMISHMYKVDDAPYPDYAGAFYYEFGDYPYADGARCEGLLGAYELAVKMGDEARVASLWAAIRLSAWALMHLVNTEDSIYFAPNPQLALGGIRFKYTRQWFRIDTIQHVASYYAKLLPYWEKSNQQSSDTVA